MVAAPPPTRCFVSLRGCARQPEPDCPPPSRAPRPRAYTPRRRECSPRWCRTRRWPPPPPEEEEEEERRERRPGWMTPRRLPSLGSRRATSTSRRRRRLRRRRRRRAGAGAEALEEEGRWVPRVDRWDRRWRGWWLGWCKVARDGRPVYVEPRRGGHTTGHTTGPRLTRLTRLCFFFFSKSIRSSARETRSQLTEVSYTRGGSYT